MIYIDILCNENCYRSCFFKLYSVYPVPDFYQIKLYCDWYNTVLELETNLNYE